MKGGGTRVDEVGGPNLGVWSTFHNISQNPRGGKTQPRVGGGEWHTLYSMSVFLCI